MIKILTIIFMILFLLTGCAGPGLYTGLKKGEIEALAKIKDAAAVCTTVNVPAIFGGGIAVFTSMDKGIYGTLEVTKDCAVKITTEEPRPKPPRPVTP